MADHYHLTASKPRKDGTTDRHRFTVASDHVESEHTISREMGYEIKRELCYDDCLGRNVNA